MYYTKAGEPFSEDLACFALIEIKGETASSKREVVGLVAANAFLVQEDRIEDSLVLPGAFPWFLGYCGPSQDPDSFVSQAQEAAKRDREYLAKLSAEARAREEQRRRDAEALARKVLKFPSEHEKPPKK